MNKILNLKDLSEITQSTKLKGTIPSGYKSDDSASELMIVEPLIKHPELDLYRAVDVNTGWKTWVEYTPVMPEQPVPVVDKNKEEYFEKLNLLRKKKDQLSLGLTTQEEYDELLSVVKTLGKSIGEL